MQEREKEREPRKKFIHFDDKENKIRTHIHTVMSSQEKNKLREKNEQREEKNYFKRFVYVNEKEKATFIHDNDNNILGSTMCTERTNTKTRKQFIYKEPILMDEFRTQEK